MWRAAGSRRGARLHQGLVLGHRDPQDASDQVRQHAAHVRGLLLRGQRLLLLLQRPQVHSCCARPGSLWGGLLGCKLGKVGALAGGGRSKGGHQQGAQHDCCSRCAGHHQARQRRQAHCRLHSAQPCTLTA